MQNYLGLSHSSIELFHACPRKFEIEKLLQGRPQEGAGDFMPSVDLICGTATGLGIQKILEGASVEEAVWEAYKIWLPLGIDGGTKSKTFHHVVGHLEKFPFTFTGDAEFEEWELVYFDHPTLGKISSCELSFRIILNKDFAYRGYIDAILRNKRTGEYAVLEIKTTGSKEVHPAMYQNSYQGSSYAIVLDKITGQKSYHVKYLVLQFPSITQTVLPFYKTQSQRLEWLASLGLDCQQITAYKQEQYFPMRGSNCYSWRKPCHYLGMCELSKPALGKYDSKNSKYAEPGPDLGRDRKPAEYHFTFTLEELLANAL